MLINTFHKLNFKDLALIMHMRIMLQFVKEFILQAGVKSKYFIVLENFQLRILYTYHVQLNLITT